MHLFITHPHSSVIKSMSKPKYIAFGATMLASASINNVFVTYYLDTFLNIVQLDAAWFFIGQTIFMFWKALNDPLV